MLILIYKTSFNFQNCLEESFLVAQVGAKSKQKMKQNLPLPCREGFQQSKIECFHNNSILYTVSNNCNDYVTYEFQLKNF